MKLRERFYDWYVSCIEAIGIQEAHDAILLEISEAKEAVTETLDELFGERDWRPMLERVANAGMIVGGVLGLVGGVLLMANLIRSLDLPRPHFELPQVHVELPQLHFELPSLDLRGILRAAVPDATDPTPSVAPSPSPTPAYFVVANTGGQGVYIRASTVMTDRIKAWPDGTYMVQVGPDGEGDGRAWKNVRAPDGTLGWIPAQFLNPAPAPTAAATPNVARTPARTATPAATVAAVPTR